MPELVTYAASQGQLQPGRPGSIFTSDLTVNEFLLLRQAGFRPLGLVLGTSVYHVGLQVGRWSRNQEMDVLSQAMYHARELAMTRMEAEADVLGADGIVAVRLVAAVAGGPRRPLAYVLPILAGFGAFYLIGHRLGLVVGLLWAVQGMTGASLVFHRELDRQGVGAISPGPMASLDRLIADVRSRTGADVTMVGAVGTEAAVNRHATTLPVLVVLSLLGFVGSVSLVRFAVREQA